MVDIAGNSTTTGSITVGGTVSNSLETIGDHDWFRIELTAGQSISVMLDGLTLEDSYLRIYDSNGQLVTENDDISPGVLRDSKLAFTASYTGTYYIDVGAWDEGYAGTYQLSVTTYAPPPVASLDAIADQLVNGYWGGDDHHFDVAQPGSITVNLSGLTPAGRTLAVAALQTWTDIIGVSFIQVATGGQIVFDDDDDGAYSDSNWSDGIISSSFVNVSSVWLANYGTGLNSYSYQTYIHEIGHALGLGHAGNYNGEASFPYDASFYNDSWATSVMSYYSQTDNSYFAGQGFTESFLMTPMLADILAMSTLYGLSTTTRTGNTTYGFNTNAGNQIYNASLYPDVAYTIYDNGGTDTLDYSGFGFNQKINLNPETFSNIGGEVGNITIARGVVIENAIGGSGNDTIIGNSANNVLSGGAGDDTLSYETATAAVNVNLTSTAQQNTIGAGLDTLSGFERLNGSSFNDTLTGSSATIQIRGGDGNDLITSTGLSEHSLYGDGGDDRFMPGLGDDWIIGGDGFDTVDYGSAAGPINAATEVANNNTGNSGSDSFGGIEKIVGSAFNDTLWAFQAGHEVWGGAGNDTLKGSGFGVSQLHGGAGNDTYEVWHAANQITEVGGEGIDLVIARASFALGQNVENLTLYEPPVDTDPYDGASPGYEMPANLNGTGNDLANVIIGNSASNILAGMGGNDTLQGGAGNDTLDGGSGADVLDGGAGDDRVTYDAADNAAQVTGGTGTDTLIVNGSAAPTAFNLAGQGFEQAEVKQTDGGANAWTSITKYYNGSWTLLQQLTINDNGSRLVADYDYNNSLATSRVENGYDALGRLSSVDQLFDDSSRTFINLDEASTQSWTQDWFQFDAQGRLSSEDVRYDDGTRTFINLDEASTQNWTQDWFQFDAQGRLSSEDIRYDNGTRTFINLDEANAHGWSQDWFAYDAQGRLSSEDIRFDNGTRTFIDIDQDNSQSWKSAWFTYDNQGRLDTQDVNYDDGSRIFYNYDQAGTESFQLTAILFNSLGVAYQQITTWDDGTTTYTMI